MKKALICLMLAAMMLLGCACAENAEYAKVPGAETNAGIVSIDAKANDTEDYAIEALQSTELSAEILKAIAEVVGANAVSPANHFDAETQAAILALLPEGVSLDALLMTEFLSVMPAEAANAADVNAQILFDADYQPGQTIVVLLGVKDEAGNLVWKPLTGEVTTVGQVTFEIPADTHEAVQGKETLFAMMSNAPAIGTAVLGAVDEEAVPTPSKTAEDLNKIVSVLPASGEVFDGFVVKIVEATEEILAVLDEMADFLKENAAVSFFGEEVAAELAKLLPEGTVLEDLVAYEVLPLASFGYDESIGEAVVEFLFATPFEVDQPVVAVLGLPGEAEGEMVWTVLPALVTEEAVQITFAKDVLTQMEVDIALMVVLSTPMAQ